MKLISNSSNLNSKLPLSVMIWEIDNSDQIITANGQSGILLQFDLLKKNNFCIQEEYVKYEPQSNYSNYLLSAIEFEDFEKIDYLNWKVEIEKRILKWSLTYNNLNKEDLTWFVKYTIEQIDSYAKRFTDFYLFQYLKNEKMEKLHPHNNIYEFFLSFICYNPNNNRNTVVYGELSYS